MSINDKLRSSYIFLALVSSDPKLLRLILQGIVPWLRKRGGINAV